ncbi:MAG: transcription-repair coupling factor [Chthonomonadales bacterium]|nr:transcription-repair coupling factor [Chthonomonadales bacterium]
MTLNDLVQRVDRLPGFDALLSVLATPGGQAQVDGLAGPAKGLLAARVLERRGGAALVVTYQAEQAQRIWDDLRRFGVQEDRLHLLPASQGRRASGEPADFRALGDRIGALAALASEAACVVIGTADAVLQRTGPPDDLVGPAFTLRVGDSVDLRALLRRLAGMGYESETTVTRPGQFSRRGGILDLFPITADGPVRAELYGDEIESLRAFDVATQRSIAPRAEAVIYPAREFAITPERLAAAAPRIREALAWHARALEGEGLRVAADALGDRVETDLARMDAGGWFDGAEEYLGYLVPQPWCALDFAAARPGERALAVLDEPAQAAAHWERARQERADYREGRRARGELLEGPADSGECASGLGRLVGEMPLLVLSTLERSYEGLAPAVHLAVHAPPMESYRARLPFLAEEIAAWRARGAQCVLVSDQPQRVREICAELGIALSPAVPAEPAEDARADGAPVLVLEGRLRQGFKFADIGLYVATDAELFGATRPVTTRRRATGGIPISSLLDLRENDYVVHVHHGIGVYRGLVKRKVDGADRDYLFVQYAGADRLYVPADQIDRVQRYIGAEGSPPSVNRIGGNEWQRTTRRVKEQARDMARELVELYAAREAARRPAFGGDTPWQAEMEDAFPYEETPSQLRAIVEVKGDLNEERPMDRLVCGDVGFGKTEVAIRAAFKVVEAGKQVAVLCPTTVLAAQHHTTFAERLAAYPITVELLSRFRTRQEQRRTLDSLEAGAVDIVIGTHRLLSKDVKFRGLGLVIVDEEQRFGVAQKERLKQLRKTVDVMTLTATPIPRTLSMALSGLRDMSVIEDPPSGRVPIVTYVREYDDDVVRDAILRELERDGQVYYVHNRVESIEFVARKVQRLVPDARMRIGHGQMSEDELEQIMYDFYHRAYDVLVCTTIIENGLDIPNVNTIIVDDADRMGLAQLYQLRGRVGRSDRQAYAYLVYRRHKQLTEVAEQRLFAIREFTALGSGFQIAMRDLEIRGAGNLLGAEQSGAMSAVGFDMYCQLLAQAVAEVKGEDVAEAGLPPVDLPVTAHIPNEYIPNEAERIFFYKRMSGVGSAEDVVALQEELVDRYGDPPPPVWNALAVLRLRLRAREAGISAVRSERRDIILRFAPTVKLTAQAVRVLTHLYRDHRFTADSVVLGLPSSRVLEAVEEMLDVLERALAEGHALVGR